MKNNTNKAYNTTFSAENTLACRNRGDNGHRATGKTNGEYVGKAPAIRNLYNMDDTLLREVTTSKGTIYELVLDGEVFNRCPSLKDATVLFVDFAGITKNQLKKVACS